MGQVTKVCLSCYLVLLSFDRKKTGNKTGATSWPDPCKLIQSFPSIICQLGEGVTYMAFLCQKHHVQIRYFHISSWDMASSKFDLEMEGQGHGKGSKSYIYTVYIYIMGPTSYWLTFLPFHVNQPFHSWDAVISKFNLENPRSGSQIKVNILLTHIPFIPCQSAHAFLSCSYIKILTLKI